jgi:hypothetical protein
MFVRHQDMKSDVIARQWRNIALHGTTGDAKINNGSFAHKFIGGKNHGAA